MVKKIGVAIVLIAVVLCGILYFAKNQIKEAIKRNPLAANIAQKVSGRLATFGLMGSGLGNLDENEAMTDAHLTVDVSSVIGENTYFWQGIGQDSFNDGVLKPHNRAYYNLIGEMNQKRPVFRSAHSKGMLCDTWNEKRDENTCGHVYREDAEGRGYFDWTVTDSVFDVFLRNNLEPLVSFTYMPSILASIRNKRNPWNKSNVSPPNDYPRWQKVISETVRHLRVRYGNQIAHWYFEVWNEPDLPQFFWVNHPDRKRYPHKGDNIEYFRLYDFTAAAAEQALPGIRVGGPAIAGDIDFFINDWLPHCESGKNFATGAKGSPVRFLSMHAYGNIETKILPGIKRFIDKAKANGKRIVENADFVITEYGPTAVPEPWLNTRYVAAWLVKLVDGLFYLQNRAGDEYMPNLMYFWTKPVPANFDKHFGLATAFGHPKHPRPHSIVKRPVFNAFDALSRLGRERISVNGSGFGDPIHAIATESRSGEIQILLYHLAESDPYNASRQTFPVSVTFKNLPFKAFRTKLYMIDESHSNAYTLWRNMSEPDRPTKDQLQQLQQNDDLELVASDTEVTTAEQSFQTRLEIQSNSVALFVLTPIQTQEGVQ